MNEDDYENYYEEDHLDFFEDESEFKNISTGLRKMLDPTSKKECPHENVKKFPDNRGYCLDCGIDFQSVDQKIILKDECKHENVCEDDTSGIQVCRDCGLEIEALDFKPEWRYYGSSDNRSSKDPSRCQKGKNNKTSIDKILEKQGIEIPDVIKNFIEQKYKLILSDSKRRGKEAKSIVAACHFYVLIDFGEYRTNDYIRNLYGISRKSMSDGITVYLEKFPDDRNKTVKPEQLIKWIMRKTGVHKERYTEIVTLSRYFDKSSKSLARSSPQSVASAIIYFYLCINPEYKASLGLTKSKFSKKADLSDITITKLVKEIARISNSTIQM